MIRRSALLLLVAMVLSACSLIPRPAAPPQELSGVLSADTRLSGTVILTGDLLVPAGRTLTIAAGTIIRIRRAESSKIDPEYLFSSNEILVRGRLNVEGSAKAPVSFLPETSVAAGDVAWGGILLDHAAPGTIRHARIEGAEHGILLVASSPEILNSHIRHCRYGIVAQAGSHPRILNNRIEQGEGGVFCWNGSNPYLKYNRIVDQVEEGLFVDAGSRPWIDRNTISGNGIGLALWPRDLPYDGTEITGNREDIRLLGGAP